MIKKITKHDTEHILKYPQYYVDENTKEDLVSVDGSVITLVCNPQLFTQYYFTVKNDYEKETGNLIVEHFRKLKLNPDEVNMVLVGGHGPFAWGSTAAKSVYNAAVMEEVSRMALNTLLIRPDAESLPKYIVEKHYLRKHGPNAYYGQSAK